MKPNVILLSLFLFAGHSVAQAQSDGLVGNKQIITQKRSVGQFDRLTVDLAMKVRITTGDATQADVQGESNVLPYVTVEAKNGELTVALSRQVRIRNTGPVTVTIHVSKLSSIRANTASSISSDLPIQAGQLTVALKEASSLTAPLTVQTLKLNLSDASKANLTGTVANDANVALDGASRLSAGKLSIVRATIDLNGASNADVHVTGTLAATADGVSTLSYSGNPTVQTQKTSGMSKIRQTGKE